VVLEQQDTYIQKINLEADFTLFLKLPQRTRNLNAKLLDDNMGGTFDDL
jgi:hypothetical protein